MKLNSVLTYLVGKLTMLDTTYQAERYLLNNGFSLIGRGCECGVFSRKGFEYVIKVMFDSHYNTDGKHLLKIPSEKHFVDTLLVDHGNFPIVIQRKVVSCEGIIRYKTPEWYRMEKFRKFVEKKWTNINDLGDYNIGIDRGQFKVFDWSDRNFAGSSY
jgi:hypothetical protein